MKYIKTITLGNNPLHKFVADCSSFMIGKKNWKNKTLSIAESKVFHCGEFKELRYLLTVRYDNSAKDYQISQFNMTRDELKLLRDVLNNILEK